jgi:hypothetical protein
MRLYGTDAVMPDHVRRMPVEQAPYLGKFAAMDMDERWVTRSPREMLDTFHRRDALFTDQLTEKIRHLGLHGIGVDSTVTEEGLARRVSAVFGLEN